MDPRVKDEPIPPDESRICALNRKSEMSDIIKQEEEDLKKALAESLKDLPGPSSAVNSWEIPPDIQPEMVPKVKPEIIEIKDEGSKCFSIFGSSRAVEKSGSTKRRGTSTRGSKTRGIKSRGRGKINSRGPLRGQTTLKRLRVDDAEKERQTKLKVGNFIIATDIEVELVLIRVHTMDPIRFQKMLNNHLAIKRERKRRLRNSYTRISQRFSVGKIVFSE